MEAGCPNIVGSLGNHKYGGYGTQANYPTTVTGCFTEDTGTSPACDGGGAKYGTTWVANISASLSSDVYGNSTTITPESCSCLFYIKY